MKFYKISITIFFLLTFFQGWPQEPTWLEFNSRKLNYPNSVYLTGFSSAKIESKKTVDEQLIALKNNARSELIESINVTVSSENILNSQEILESQKRNNSYSQNYSSKTVTTATANLIGLKIETWHDKKSKQLYAFASVKRIELIDYYKLIHNNKKTQIKGLIKDAALYKTAEKNSAALTCYRDCLPLLTELVNGASVILALEKKQLHAELNELSSTVRQGIEEITNIKASVLSDAADILVDELFNSLKNRNLSIQVFPFTYQDSRLAGQFSGILSSNIKQSMVQKGFSVVENNGEIELLKTSVILRGSYWEENNQLRIIGTITDNYGSILACAESLLANNWFETNNVSWLPERFEEAGERLKFFAKDEIIGGGLRLELWTNKGNESPIFEKGDTLRFYIRTSHPCYIRIINYLADDSKVLLLDNEYIGMDKVNKVVKISHEFECAEPFGTEILQVNAQTEAFKPLATHEKWGYSFIIDDLNKILGNTRGFKPIKNEDMTAEKRIIVTSIDR